MKSRISSGLRLLALATCFCFLQQTSNAGAPPKAPEPDVVQPWLSYEMYPYPVSPIDGMYAPGDGTIAWNWFSSEVTNYHVRIVHHGMKIVNIAHFSDNYCFFRTLLNPGTYTLFLRPQNEYGYGPWASCTATVRRNMAPSDDTVLPASPLKLTWTRTQDAVRYQVKLSRYDRKEMRYKTIGASFIDQPPGMRAPKWKLIHPLRAGHYKWTVTDYVGTKKGFLSAAYFKVIETTPLDIEMVRLLPGSFMMGSPAGESGRGADEFSHRVTLTKGFYMGTFEVTRQLWQYVMESNFVAGARQPVSEVSWTLCQQFIEKLNHLIPNGGFRLPTEAEWEYACRAGSTGPYAGNLDRLAWVSGNSYYSAHLVGLKKPNAWGLYDMHGNVIEWCQDWYGDYPVGPVTDPRGPLTGDQRCLRGGSWHDEAAWCRSATRNAFDPMSYLWYVTGLRLARDLPAPE